MISKNLAPFDGRLGPCTICGDPIKPCRCSLQKELAELRLKLLEENMKDQAGNKMMRVWHYAPSNFLVYALTREEAKNIVRDKIHPDPAIPIELRGIASLAASGSARIIELGQGDTDGE